MLAKPSSLCHKKAVSTLILAGLYMKNRKGTSFDPDDGFLLPPEERAIRRSPEEQKERGSRAAELFRERAQTRGVSLKLERQRKP